MLKKKEKKTEHIHLVVTPTVKKNAQKVCKKYNMSMNELGMSMLIQAWENAK